MEVFPIESKRSSHEWFLSRHLIDFKPSYQREAGLWPKRNQALLINSILNGFDIPKIYFADFAYGPTNLKEKNKLYAIIDGKQRLTTIFSFFEDDIELDDTPVSYRGREIKLTGAKYSTLKEFYPDLATKVEDYQLSIMSVISDKKEEINELFIRLNLNVTISGPEIRNAMPGPIPQLVRNLSLHSVFKQNISFNIKRGQGLNAITKIAAIKNEQNYPSLGKAGLNKFVRDNANRNYDEFSVLESEIKATLDFMETVFRKPDALLKSQNIFVVYYFFCEKHLHVNADEIRNFLKVFEDERLRVARLIKSGSLDDKNVTPDIYPYFSYNSVFRSPDNKSSLDLMLDTLTTLFDQFR